MIDEDKSISNYLVCFTIIFCVSCGITTKYFPGKKQLKALQLQVDKSPVFNRSFTGFSLYDPQRKKYLVSHNSDKYFTPASNTKIFTLYASLQVIRDSIPALKYQVTENGFYFGGTGNPDLLHPYLAGATGVIDFLREIGLPLYFVVDSTQDKRFGPGWAWEDYRWSYQPERNAFPIYGNILQANGESSSRKVSLIPAYFQKYLNIDPAQNSEDPRIWRVENENIFHYNHVTFDSNGYDRDIPFRTSNVLTIRLLEDILGKPIRIAPKFPTAKINYLNSRIPLDSILARMMKVSDNFLAEQLMIVCGGILTDTLQVAKAIRILIEKGLHDLPDYPMWYDGSGLSRYNLFTPRTIIKVLEKIYLDKGMPWIQKIFAAGGDNGSISEWYPGLDSDPYVWAKTGTLRNKHALSGFIITRKNNLYIFSFMHNNYVSSSNIFKVEMQKVLEYIYLNY